MFQYFQNMKPEKKPMVYALIGAAIAIVLMTLGFWRALVVAVFAAIGYVIGSVPNKGEHVRDFINKKFPPKNQ